MGLLDNIWDTKLNYTTTSTSLPFWSKQVKLGTAALALADTEPHAELPSSEVTSVPWLCTDIHSFKLKQPKAPPPKYNLDMQN